MLDINLIREQPELIRETLRKRQMDASAVDQVLERDKERRTLIQEVENLKAERNVVSKEIGRTKDPEGTAAGTGADPDQTAHSDQSFAPRPDHRHRPACQRAGCEPYPGEGSAGHVAARWVGDYEALWKSSGGRDWRLGRA